VTINDLLIQIHSSDCDAISVERHALKTGNTDGAGNYSIIQLSFDGQLIEFNNSTGTWAAA